jgi:hypothetical protein
MHNPLHREPYARLAAGMLESASKLPRGHRVALVMADGCAICFGHEQGVQVQNIVLLLQRRLFAKGIETTAFALSENGLAWVLVGVMPPPGCKARALEAELDKLLRNFRLKAPRRRRRAGKVPGRSHDCGEAGAAA